MTAIPNPMPGENDPGVDEEESLTLTLYKGDALFIRPSDNPYTTSQYASDPFVHGIRMYDGYKTVNVYKVKNGIKTKTIDHTERVEIPATTPAEVITFLIQRAKLIEQEHVSQTRAVLEDFQKEFEDFLDENGVDFTEEYLNEQAMRYSDAAILAEMPKFIEGVTDYHAHTARELIPFLKRIELFAKYMVVREQSTVDEEPDGV